MSSQDHGISFGRHGALDDRQQVGGREFRYEGACSGLVELLAGDRISRRRERETFILGFTRVISRHASSEWTFGRFTSRTMTSGWSPFSDSIQRQTPYGLLGARANTALATAGGRSPPTPETS